MTATMIDSRYDARAANCIALSQAASDAGFDLMGRVAAARSHLHGRIVFTTSFGMEDQAIAHAIFLQALEIEVVTLDTGRLFPETYELWAHTESRYGQRIEAIYPDGVSAELLVARQGIQGFYASVEARRACCQTRKVRPLERALTGATAWIAGLRADQSDERAGISFAAVDSIHQLITVNPLFDWTRERVVSFIRRHGIPYNSLHDRGFASIGCAPCTRAIASGEPERAGRWWWEHEEKKECGLHQPRHLRSPAPARSEHSAEEATHEHGDSHLGHRDDRADDYGQG